MRSNIYSSGCLSVCCMWSAWPRLHSHSVGLIFWKNTVCLHLLLIWAWLPSINGFPGSFPPMHAPRDFCEAETFEPACQEDQVVVITSAAYGRMEKGKCVLTDYGYIGCQQDIQMPLDHMCSGRDTCTVRIPNQILDGTSLCPREFKIYMKVAYACVQVETTECPLCRISRDENKQALLSISHGYLASWTTKITDGCGSSTCPWVIEAKPGQKINVTMWDFSNRSQSGRSWPGNNCNRFGVIKESTTSDTPICRGRERERNLYESVSNKIEIHVVSPAVLDKAGHFLLYYEAIGCPDYDAPDHTNFRRIDDLIIVGCDSTKKEWKLHCVGTEWHGEVGHCPPGPPPPENGQFSLPLGVLIAIVVGIALVIGVLILTIGIVCLKRQQHDLHQTSETTLYVRARQEPEYREDYIPGTRLVPKYETTQLTLSQKPPTRMALPPPQQQQQQVLGTAAHGGPRENLYCRRMESRPLPSLPNLAEQPIPPPPSSSDDDVEKFRVQVHRTGSGREQHCHYQPRIVTRRAHSTGSSSRDDPQYFVLDPDDLVIEDEEDEDKSPSASASTSQAPRKRIQSASTSGGAAAHVPTPAVHAPTCAASSSSSGSPSTSSSKSQPNNSKPNQKSPEEENVENDTKEVHLNSSCHEIPLRPSREGSQTSKVPETTNTGNSSWP